MNAPLKPVPRIGRPAAGECILAVTGRAEIVIRAGAVIDGAAFPADVPVAFADPVAGRDYAVVIGDDGGPVAIDASAGVPENAAGGFHFAPGGNAPPESRRGGDAVPAINPFSCWDAGFRPACPDPRGMAFLRVPDGRASWVDIYKLGADHLARGTSRFGVAIADGRDPPRRPGGDGSYERFDFDAAVEVLAHHGKTPLDYDEFRAAAMGVTERTAAGKDPKETGLDAARTSRIGLMQATGNLWDWGTDGDPDEPRASLFGGSWICGDFSGSRCAYLDSWPGSSGDGIGARGRCDHYES